MIDDSCVSNVSFVYDKLFFGADVFSSLKFSSELIRNAFVRRVLEDQRSQDYFEFRVNFAIHFGSRPFLGTLSCLTRPKEFISIYSVKEHFLEILRSV